MTANIQLSYRDQHGRIFVVGGDTPAEFETNLVGMFGGNQDAVGRVLEDFQILADPPVAQAVANAAPLRTSPGASAPAAGSPPPPGGPSCQHGPRRYKDAFTSQAGRPMPSSWQCTSRDRTDQCKAVWNDN